ncbi:MAG: hypothetical protein IJ315_02245 [Firmicutes bacterium]|nr:hypothetical protein [Bacillota bacterium]
MKQFDLSLGQWGPFNKEYLGVSHIADQDSGASFEVTLFPGLFRKRILVSHSVSDSGLKMWAANGALTHFVYRYELEWKDRVYCDADFAITDDKLCTITCHFVNHTELPQSVNMNLCASLQRPTIKDGAEFVKYQAFSRADHYIDAVEYSDIFCNSVLAVDGKYLGEMMMDGASGKGTVLGAQYFDKPEYWVKYMPHPTVTKGIGVRYQAKTPADIRMEVNGVTYSLHVEACQGFGYVVLPLEETKVSDVVLYPQGISVDALVLGENAVFEEIPHDFEPERTIEGNRMILQYPGIPHTYTLQWMEAPYNIRRFYCDDVGPLLEKTIHKHVNTVFTSGKSSENVYENIFSNPLYLEPGEEKELIFKVWVGEEIQAKPAAPLYAVTANSDGEKYLFSQNLMTTTTFLNVVYPIYTRRQFIRHNTPGRNWDSLYTWDSGFTGMGLAVMDYRRAFDCLYTYLTPVGDKHSPFIFHGSVVPTQMFLYKELIERYGEHREELASLYPMMRQYYQFFAQMDKGEKQMKSGLLKTWHIFYNSGGWDDYPPQHMLNHATQRGGEPADYHNTTPVITTAITVLIARIMKQAAQLFGYEEDIAGYDADIEKYSGLVQSLLWDDEAGYYSYMVHDEDGNPKEFLRYQDGSNYNQGMDGIYPYIAGISTDVQNRRMMDHVKNGMMTPIGVGVVDQRASYYTPYGYWNGSVWMPHQWILWKSLLDHGETELAWEIAQKALNLWARETDDTYSCFEHFMSANGRGAGFHQFSGLSTPVLMFFDAYYKPGSVTTGFMTMARNVRWNADKTEVSLDCRVLVQQVTVMIVMQEGREYHFTVNGQEAKIKKITAGGYEVTLAAGENHIHVQIR